MYCPKCAAQNIDDAQFCRTCGADVSRVPQAMTGRLPEKEQQTIEKGIRYFCIGTGFLIVAIAIALLAPAPVSWAICFSMLMAAFPLLGSGVAKIVYVKYGQRLTRRAVQNAVSPAQDVSELLPRNTSEVVQPRSVTEGTTRMLDTEKTERA